MEEKKEIKIRLSTVIYLFIIVLLVVTLGVTYYFGFVSDNNDENIEDKKLTNTTENVVSNTNTTNEIKEDKVEKGNVQISKYEWEKYPNDFRKELAKWAFDYSDKDIFSKDTPKTLYSVSKKYSDFLDCPFYKNFDLFVLADGDSTEIFEIESNYTQYTYKSTKLAKYDNEITFKLATFNEAYDLNLDGDYTLEQRTKSQSDDLKSGKKDYHYDDIPKDRKFYYEIPAMLVMNGNNTSENDYKNNARAKKIKVIVNEDKEYIFDLKDTNAVQVFDIDYKQDTIEEPVNIKVEVLETYAGEKTEDVYISDIQFSIESNIPQGR